jgi:hypothetical protein
MLTLYRQLDRPAPQAKPGPVRPAAGPGRGVARRPARGDAPRRLLRWREPVPRPASGQPAGRRRKVLLATEPGVQPHATGRTARESRV